MATYPCAIPSLLAQHPALAPLAVALPELNNSEAAGAPLRPAAVDEARLITTVLQAAHERNPNAPVTLNIINEAHTRQTIIESLHGADTHLGGLANTLAATLSIALAPHINSINATIARGQAIQFNMMAEFYGQGFRGLPKTVVGSGIALATAMAVGGVQIPPATNSAVNTVCPLLLAATAATISAFSHAQILTLIEYYNEDFGIVPGDTVTQRQAKVFRWVRFG